MNNSESPLHQQKSNLELSAAVSFSRNQEVHWIPLLPFVLHAFLHRQSFGIWQQTDFFFAPECPHVRLKQVLCSSVCSNPAVSIQGCSETFSALCVFVYFCVPLQAHMQACIHTAVLTTCCCAPFSAALPLQDREVCRDI